MPHPIAAIPRIRSNGHASRGARVRLARLGLGATAGLPSSVDLASGTPKQVGGATRGRLNGFLRLAFVIIAICSTLRLTAAEANPASDDTAQPISFSRDVGPILSDRCFKCHGPDEGARQADLRLDLRDEALYVLAPEEPGESELLRRITSTDPDEQMPPPDSKLSISAAEIETLRRWIEQGASYERHWAFAPLAEAQPPAVDQHDWPRGPIDHFVLAQLQRLGLAPAPQAARETLIRRLSFDLTGLPPTLEEIDAFLADTSDDAYERLVDHMLGKTAYGERMTANWLDVARYSDTYGYQVDRNRSVWRWRDWVIRAFNDNMHYDEFVTWQLAGDMLPGASDEQVLATTFNRLHPQKTEGGSVPEEFRVEYVADRVHTFATAFLGLTMECARCHDHKYDPILQREYYQLFAFFNNIDEAGLYSYHTSAVPTPTLLLHDEDSRRRLAEADAAVTTAERTLATLAESRTAEFSQWLESKSGNQDIAGRIAHLDFEETDLGANARVAGVKGQAVQLTGDDAIGLEVGNFRRFNPFSIALWMNTPDLKQRAVVFHRSGAWTDSGSRGYQMLIEDGRLSASLIHFWPGNAIRVRTLDPIPTNEWLHVAITYDGSSRADGLSIFIDGQRAACEVVRDHLYKNITGGGGDNLSIGARTRDRGFTGGLVDEFQVFERQLTSLEMAQLFDDHSLDDALQTPPAELTTEVRDQLLSFYLSRHDAEYQQQLAALRDARAKQCETADAIAEIMVMRDMRQPRPTFLLKRGAYDAPAEPVEPTTPAALPPFPDDYPPSRLGLAQWLTGPGHPLASRVAVNRLWQLCFGQGLVRTPEDFGSQGQPPTHPELLDWLARDFVANDWDIQHTLKLIVMSATYRQSSVASPEKRAADPDNRWLSRAPSYRWPAEMIRDNALAASGLLVSAVGGPPVRPYEVAVSFKPVEPDNGDGLYRRSLYTYWKRTAPAPVMMSLDASKRDVCTVKRERTSSPLQALVLLNDPQLVEAARKLAEQQVDSHGTNVSAAIEHLFRLLTSRRPSAAELNVLKLLFDEQQAHFATNAEATRQFLGEEAASADATDAATLASLSVVAGALLNYDECVTKR